jgi:hypothetical protein
MALFTTALGLYGGVLWSGELEGFIIHQMMPNARGSPRPPGSPLPTRGGGPVDTDQTEVLFGRVVPT